KEDQPFQDCILDYRHADIELNWTVISSPAFSSVSVELVPSPLNLSSVADQIGVTILISGVWNYTQSPLSALNVGVSLDGVTPPGDLNGDLCLSPTVGECKRAGRDRRYSTLPIHARERW
ncbi:MAG: hypothetical protein OJI67_10015, partial [Prosthecobacter sp.]|nr:hypothetical protein [Prosthecobacter sp.]